MAAEPLRVTEETSTRAFEPRLVQQQPTSITRQDQTPARQAYRILQMGFVAAPIIAGADKFFNMLTNWEQYLAPIVPNLLGISANTFMRGVGVIEMVAGIGVALKPKIFSYVVSAWLMGIVVNLLLTGQYFDIALRDFGLALGALALGRLAGRFDNAAVR